MMLSGARLGREERQPTSAALQQRRNARSGHRGLTVTRLVGMLLMGLAVGLALDPEYPIPADHPLHASSARRALRAPRPLLPRGTVELEHLRFSWSGPAPEEGWDLVVVDEDLLEIGRIKGLRASPCRPDPEFRASLQPGHRYRWFLTGREEGRTLGSFPWTFEVFPAGGDRPLAPPPR